MKINSEGKLRNITPAIEKNYSVYDFCNSVFNGKNKPSTILMEGELNFLKDLGSDYNIESADLNKKHNIFYCIFFALHT